MTYTPAPSTYRSTPAQWADDWLTPDEARALRAEDRAAALSRPAPAKPLTIQPRARQRSLGARLVQRACQTVAWGTIALAIVGLWYIACVMAAILSTP